MSRTKQQLINYHTGSKSSMPLTGDVQLGEIVVRHNYEEPQLLIKVVGENNQEYFVPFIASAQISTAIEAIVTESEGTLDAKINAVSSSTVALSGSVINNYMTSADTIVYVESAITVANEYAVGQDKELSGNMMTYVSGVVETINQGSDALNQRVTALEGFSGYVETNYATKEYADAESAAAVTTVVGSDSDESSADTIHGAKKYTDEKVKSLSGDILTYIDSNNDTYDRTIKELSGTVATVSGHVETLSGNVVDYIDTRLSTVYTYKGTVNTYEDLPESGKTVGFVYNVVSGNGTTPPGTNYAWNGSAWDALGGSVDLSPFATNTALEALDNRVDTLDSNLTTTTNNLTALSGVVSAFSATMASDYATQDYVDQAKLDAEIASSAYTDSQIEMLSAITSAYMDTRVSTIESNIENLQNDSATHAEVSTASGNAIESAVSISSGYSKEYTDAEITKLIGGMTGDPKTLRELEERIDSFSSAATGDLTALEARVSANEGKFAASAGTWNNATQGGELGTASPTPADHHTTQSGAEMSWTEGGKIILDLTSLKIDCGDF